MLATENRLAFVLLRVFQIDIDAKKTLSECTLQMFRASSCGRWWLIIISLAVSGFFAVLFWLLCQNTYTPPFLLILQICREKATHGCFQQQWLIIFADSVHQHCISGLRLGNSRIIFFILVFISFHLSAQYWIAAVRKHRAPGRHTSVYRGTADEQELWLCLPA